MSHKLVVNEFGLVVVVRFGLFDLKNNFVKIRPMSWILVWKLLERDVFH